MAADAVAQAPVAFDTQPGAWSHWDLEIDGGIARLSMNVKEDGGLNPGYELKLNSYDLGVDIELYDIVQRLRFEQPQVRSVVLGSAFDRVFCAGANIRMLASSTHAFKVNFCKYTNETRCAIEQSSQESGLTWIAALRGACAGGGYELAMACDEIYLVDDGNSTVSLPEVPLLGVLPGTGGLTRLIDKRKVRRDLADVFCTKAEGFKARDAVAGRFVDGAFPRSRWDDSVQGVAQAALDRAEPFTDALGGIQLTPLKSEATDTGRRWSAVEYSLDDDARVATLTLHAPKGPPPGDHAALHALGAQAWSLRCFRELERALLELRFNHPQHGLILLHTRGDTGHLLAWEQAIARLREQGSWLAREIQLFQGLVLRRLDNMARSMFALVDEDSAFAGLFFELALAADRTYMFLDDDEKNTVRISAASAGAFPMATGLTRLANRFFGEPDKVGQSLGIDGPIGAEDAMELGLVTMSLDDIDWEDEVRIAIEERASLSPDALTGMEQNLRFAGKESPETRIYGRLSAWQNWIFQRPNAVGVRGALTMYGHPERPSFDFDRT